MNASININTDALIRYTNKLEQLSKSALPVVVRQTLNSAGYDLKQKTMPAHAREAFEQRQANFFKVSSKVIPAQGFSINDMKCEVGFTAPNKYANQAVADLAQQEAGGTIEGRSFIPMDTARQGGNHSSLVKASNRLTNIQKIIKARDMRGRNKQQQMIQAAVVAGKGGYIIAEDRKGQDILWRVNNLNRQGRNMNMSLTPLYNFSKGRKVKVNETEFMEKATMETARRMPEFFIRQAERKFKKELE